MLGRFFETFVVMQIMPLVALSSPRIQAFHVREGGGANRREIDLILQGPRGGVVAIEVKARAEATSTDARHLAWLRDALGDRFLRGLVVHAGSYTTKLSDRIWSMPVASFWRSSDSS
jgi:hypothetical protein